MMATRFESHVQGRTGGEWPGSIECEDLGVGSTKMLVVANTDNPAIGDHGSPDHGIRFDRAPTSFGLSEGSGHPGPIESRRHQSGADDPDRLAGGRGTAGETAAFSLAGFQSAVISESGNSWR